MSTNWQGSERTRTTTISLTDPRPEESIESERVHPLPASAGQVAAETPVLPLPEAADAGQAPLVSGRRSAAVLQKDNVNDQLPPETGWQAFLRAMSFGLINPKAGAAELARRADLSAIQRIYSRPMQIMVAQPLGGVGKTMCSVGLGSTFGIHSGQQTLVWDNNEMMGTAGVRTNSNGSSSTVWDLLNVLESFETVAARKGELSYYTRHQGNNQFSVLVADEDADRMKSIGAEEFNRIHTVVSRFYDTIIVDTGNNTRSANWLASIDVTDQLVIPTTLKQNAVVSALRMIEQLESMSERTGNPHYKNLVNNAVVLVTQGGGAKTSTREQRELRTILDSTARTLIDIPYDKALDTGSIIDWQLVTDPARRAFERAAAEIAAGLQTADATPTPPTNTINR